MIYALAVYFLFNLVILFFGNLVTPKDQPIKIRVNLTIMLLGLPLFLFILLRGGKTNG